MKIIDRFSNFAELHGDFSVDYRYTSGATKGPFHLHDAYEIVFVLSNDVEITVNSETFPVPFGSILIFNAMDLHQIRYTGDDAYKRFVVWFKHDFLNSLESMRDKLLRCFFIRNFEKSNMLIPNKEQFDFFLDAFNSLKAYSTNQSTTPLKLKLGEILFAINEMVASAHTLSPSTKKAHLVSVYNAMQYIHEKYSDDIDQDKLAKIAGCTKRTLCANFKTLTGMSTGQYILHCRINAAKSYLVQGLSVSEVCYKTGFANFSNFSRTFYNHTGISPKQYAMKHRV